MSERCEDCHWFKPTAWTGSLGGVCRFNAPGPNGFTPVLRGDFCSRFKLRLAVPRRDLDRRGH